MSAARKLDGAPIADGTFPHTTTPDGIIYGPFANGPMGSNLGINVLGTSAKVCSFNCAYCDLGATTMRLNRLKTDVKFPTLLEIETSVGEAFKKIHSSGPAIDGVCLSGNGEPTLHPDFPELVKIVISARNTWLPGKPISLFTNGANLDTRKISEAANQLDKRVVKIDAGNEKVFKAINGPLSRSNLARVLMGVRKLDDVIVQSLFHQGAVDNTLTTDVDDWIEVIAILKPKAVHIYGLSRPAATPGLIRCDEDTIYSIASRLERRTQIKAIVIP